VKPSPATAKEEVPGTSKDDGIAPKDDAAVPPPSSPDRGASGSSRKSDNKKLESTPTTEPLSPTHSRATAQDSSGNAFQQVLNPYYHYQQGTPPPPSPGTYDIHAMLLQQQAAMGASPYTPAQTYSGGMPPPPPLSPGQNAASNSSGSGTNHVGSHMVSPLMSPVTYAVNQFDQSNSSLTGEAPPNSPPLYLGQQAVPNSPVTSYAGIYPQYGSTSPGGAGTTKWAGTSQQNQAASQAYPVQYQNQYSRSESVQSADSTGFNDMLNPSTMGQQNPAQAAYSQYAARQLSGAAGAAGGAQSSWGYASGQSPYGAATMPRQTQQQQTYGQPRPGGYQQGGRYGGAPAVGGYPPGAPYYAATTPGPPIQTTPSNKGPDGANLFIFHIPNHFTNLDMYNLFCPYGNLLSVRIMVEKDTGRSRGFGFVSYDSPDSAAMAIKELNGFAIGNKRLKVQHKQIRPGEFGGPPSPEGGVHQVVLPDGHSAQHGGPVDSDVHGGGAGGLPPVPAIADGLGNEGNNADENAPSLPTFEKNSAAPHQIRSAPTSSNSPLGQFDAIRSALPEA